MRIGFIGNGPHTEIRLSSVRDWNPFWKTSRFIAPLAEATAGFSEEVDAFLQTIDVAFLSISTADHFFVAEAAAKRGVHVFLEWPPATSIRECAAMIRLIEEAGVEVGVSRPLRFHPLFDRVSDVGRLQLMLLNVHVAHAQETAWPRPLADALDLCQALAGTTNIQRIDAQAVRSMPPWPDAVAFGLRFYQGTYAQVAMRFGDPSAQSSLYLGGSRGHQDLELPSPLHPTNEAQNPLWVSLVEAETQAFLNALATHQPAPVSILDGLQTMRLVERLLAKLR